MISAVFSFIPFPESWWESYNAAASSFDEISVVNIVAISVVAPIAEEVLFRGLVFTRISRGLGVYVGAVVSAALFGLMHGTMIWGIFAGVLALIIAFVFVRTRSLIYAMLIHFSFNTVSYFFDGISIPMLIISSVLLVAAMADLVIVSSRSPSPAKPLDNGEK